MLRTKDMYDHLQDPQTNELVHWGGCLNLLFPSSIHTEKDLNISPSYGLVTHSKRILNNYFPSPKLSWFRLIDHRNLHFLKSLCQSSYRQESKLNWYNTMTFWSHRKTKLEDTHAALLMADSVALKLPFKNQEHGNGITLCKSKCQ